LTNLPLTNLPLSRQSWSSCQRSFAKPRSKSIRCRAAIGHT
jgi:hypothetical protein